MSTDTAPRIHTREPQVLARDTAYVAAALADDAVTHLQQLVTRLEELRDEAPSKAKELRETGPQKLRELPEDAQATLEARRARLEERITELREKLAATADERIASLEQQFDAKAAAGAERLGALRQDERVVRVQTALEPVTDQLKIARSQVKGAVTSVRKTVDVAVEAGRAQADTARSQVKAAATSTRKTVDAAVDAGKDIAS